MTRRTDPAASGVLVVDKPAGLTSHQVVGRIRRLAGTRKVGHAGTLDPMATGVLVIGIQRATRLLGHLALGEKEYRATIRLGISTVTDDAEGTPVDSVGAEHLDRAALDRQIAALTGEIQQVPSAVSAIKVDGVRSYAKVRAGDRVDLAARPVTVSRFAVLSRTDHRLPTEAGRDLPVVDLDVEVTCSAGTYIRALARDLGTALGTGGHLTSLRRIRSGNFGVDRARTLEQLEEEFTVLGIDDLARQEFPAIDLDDRRAAWVRNGRRLPDLQLTALTALFAPDGSFLALYRPANGDAVPEAVFAA